MSRAAAMSTVAIGVSLSRVQGEAEDAPLATAPVVADDHLVLTPLTYQADVDVLANDGDPDGDDLQVCRIEAPDDEGPVAFAPHCLAPSVR